MAKKLYEVRVKEVQIRTLIYEVKASTKAGALRAAKYKHKHGVPDDEVFLFDAYSDFAEPFYTGVEEKQ